MTYYIKQNNTYRVGSNDAIDISTTLPPNNYIVQQDAHENFFLEHISDFILPKKIYGSVNRHTNRIITTYNESNSVYWCFIDWGKRSWKYYVVEEHI